MKNEGMTELQRQALEHLGKARQEGLSISAYARAHEIPAQRIFDAIARLRRRGALLERVADGSAGEVLKGYPRRFWTGEGRCRQEHCTCGKSEN
jgi:hypothetical protein